MMTNEHRLAKLYEADPGLPFPIEYTEAIYWLRRIWQIDENFAIQEFAKWWENANSR